MILFGGKTSEMQNEQSASETPKSRLEALKIPICLNELKIISHVEAQRMLWGMCKL